MSFIESPRFPDSIAFTAVGGPGFSTNVVTLVSGYEARNVNWAEARHTYDLAIPARTQQEVDEINAFFRNAQGKANGFRLRDWSDYSVTKAPAVSTGASPDVVFQMQKTYTSGTVTMVRKITKPVQSTVKVYVNDVLQTSGYSVDQATGLITFTSPPASTVTWSGEFDVPVRFDVDMLRWRVIDRSADGLLYQVEALPVVEVRV
jgi:uncharacterized protein (TIGR02217 family)